MRIAVRGGHNALATGASALINELHEDRKVKDAVIKYLRQEGHEVLDVTPGECDVMADLIYGVDKAEDFGTDLFISCHFDKCYDSYNGSLGHACWIYSENSSSRPIAQRIVNSVVNGTGFKNRGVRYNPGLYELRKTSMPTVIVETCFCEATEDVKIYREKGADLIGKLIAEGITEKNIKSTETVQVEHNNNNAATNRYSENGTCSVKTTLNIRTEPSTSSEIVGHYNNGESVVYDTVVLTDKYVWISWIGASGNRRYMAIKDRINNKRWGFCS